MEYLGWCNHMLLVSDAGFLTEKKDMVDLRVLGVEGCKVVWDFLTDVPIQAGRGRVQCVILSNTGFEHIPKGNAIRYKQVFAD